MYEWFLFGHVLFVIVWVGGGVMTQIFGLRAIRASDPGRLTAFAQDASWAGMRVFMPSGVLTLLFGVLLVINGNWGFEEPWISIGFLGFFITAVTGMAVLAPTSRRLESAIAEHGPSSEQAGAIARRLVSLLRIDLVVLVLVVLVMSIKPGA